MSSKKSNISCCPMMNEKIIAARVNLAEEAHVAGVLSYRDVLPREGLR